MSRKDGLIVLMIFALTFILRLALLPVIENDPIFKFPIVDSLEFNKWAVEILNGQILWDTLQNHTPLYAYFLAGIYFLIGYNPPAAVLFQYLLASLGNVLIFYIARKTTNTPIAIISTIFMAMYWFFLYIQSFLYGENLSLIFNILLISVLIFLKDGCFKYGLGGVLFGLSIICRPDILLFAILIFFWILNNPYSWPTRIKHFGLFSLFWLLIITPVILRNYGISKEFPILRTQVGANFYLGNNPEFKGTIIHVKIGKDWEDFISMPHNYYKRNVSETESNKFYFSETLRIIQQRPREWTNLMASKILSLLTGREFLRSEDVYFYGRYMASSPFSWISTRLIFILGVLGIFISFSKNRDRILLYLIILSNTPIIFFQIKTRYFMPIMPFLIIFASLAIFKLYHYLKTRNWTKALLSLCLLAILNFLSLANPLQLTTPTVYETYYAIAKNFQSIKSYASAEHYYLRAIQGDPLNLSALNDYGVLLLHNREYTKALTYFEKALQIDPHAIKPNLNLRLCQELIAKQQK